MKLDARVWLPPRDSVSLKRNEIAFDNTSVPADVPHKKLIPIKLHLDVKERSFSTERPARPRECEKAKNCGGWTSVNPRELSGFSAISVSWCSFEELS